MNIRLQDADIYESVLQDSDTDKRRLSDLAARYEVLRRAGVDYETTRKAWFTVSHLLLEDGGRALVSGCGDGTLVFVMAALHPEVHFIGMDKNHELIGDAMAKFALPNLEFKVGDITSGVFKDESLDAIINSHVLHHVYSGARYNRKAVEETLRTQFKMLKPRGVMFLQDYLHPPPERFVQIEMPDEESASDEIEDLCNADLLEWYAAHARPLEDAACQGFFLEEMPARRPGTRLYRLPYKWAYEFVMRLKDRDLWSKTLPTEYMVFTPLEFRQSLQSLGARVQYSAPHWDEDYMKENFIGKFKLFDENGVSLHYPPTSFVAVAVKMEERKSLHIEERRPSNIPEDTLLTIKAMRNNETGELVDVVQHKDDIAEMLPYRVDQETGRLKVYLNDGVARSITNAVMRSGDNLDGKRWSGHMIEAIGVPHLALDGHDEFERRDTIRFAKDYLGLRADKGAEVILGPDYYPAPDYIDVRIYTYYLAVKKSLKYIEPKPPIDHAGKFHAKGRIREFDAQQVLDAITVGVIPNARLELQILSLFNHLEIVPENWSAKEFSIKQNKLTNDAKVFDLLKIYGGNTKMFQDVKGTAGTLRLIHSIFVEEGQAEDSVIGLSAQEVDFVLQSDKTINTAVVLPIAKSMKNELHAGVQFKQMPVPQRHEGNSTAVSVPSFELPAKIKSPDDARNYIADQLGVMPEMVIRLGESYFSHIGVTPQRIHPYAVISPPTKLDYAETHFVPFRQLRALKKLIGKDVHFLSVIARSYKMFNDELRREMTIKSKAILKERFAHKQPDWSTPSIYESPPDHLVQEVVKEKKTPDLSKISLKGADKNVVAHPFHAQSQEKNIKNLSKEFPDKQDDIDAKIKEDAPELQKW